MNFDKLLKIDKLHNKIIKIFNYQEQKFIKQLKNNLSNQIMEEIFEKRENLDYNLCQTEFLLPGVNKTYFGLNLLRYFISIICNIIPDKNKNSINSNECNY